MRRMDIKLKKVHGAQVAEARGSFFAHFFAEARGSGRYAIIIIHSLDISFLHLKILAMRNPLISFSGLLPLNVVEPWPLGHIRIAC